MKKLRNLLHSITLVNFPMVAKLVLRYRLATLGGVLLFAWLVPFYYQRQAVIFQKEVHFKIFAQARTSASDKLGIIELAEGPNSGLNMPEVLSVVNTYDFTTQLARHLVGSEHFSKLNFLHPTATETATVLTLRNCKTDECRIPLLRNLVPNLYSLNSDVSSGRHSLKIISRSALTTLEVLRCFQITLEEVRIQNAAVQVEKLLTQMQGLATKSKNEIVAKQGFEKIASAEFLDALIAQHKDKLRSLSMRLVKDDNQYFSQRIQLKESNLSAQNLIEGKDRLTYENYTKVNRRIDELRQNIASINSTHLSTRTETDGIVLAQLKNELAETELELKRFGQLNRNVAVDEKFIDAQKGNKSALEFDYKVTTARVLKLREEYEDAKAELDDLYSQKAQLENELVALKPDLEYLKLLETKLVTLKFKQSSITSDVAFEHYGGEVASFKRSSLTKITVFAALFVAFLLFNLYLVMYIFDDRIFDEAEIQKCIDELPIVGQAPYFE